MPIYEYRCERGHTFEVLQRMSEDPLSTCTSCGAGVQRVFHPVAVHFKGSGFYSTDYGKKGAGAPTDAKGDSDSSSGAGSASDSGSTSDSGAGKDSKGSKTPSDSGSSSSGKKTSKAASSRGS